MITFTNIGNRGRFGNQIFQYSMLFGLAKRKGYDYCIPNRTECTLSEVFDGIRFGQPVGIKRTTQEPTNCGTGVYLKDIENTPDDSDFIGYFQCPKYFEHCSNELKSHLRIKEKYLNVVKSFIQTHGDLGFIHVRRGDYTRISDYHPPVTVEYIKAGVEISKAKKFVVLSDDLAWCKNNLSFLDPIYSPFSEMEIGYDFALMTECTSAIIANSSFSWWGAWLGKTKDVIAPKKWFGNDPNAPKEWSEIYCQDWKVV